MPRLLANSAAWCRARSLSVAGRTLAAAIVARTSSNWPGLARGARWAVTVSEYTVSPTASRCFERQVRQRGRQ